MHVNDMSIIKMISKVWLEESSQALLEVSCQISTITGGFVIIEDIQNLLEDELDMRDTREPFYMERWQLIVRSLGESAGVWFSILISSWIFSLLSAIDFEPYLTIHTDCDEIQICYFFSI